MTPNDRATINALSSSSDPGAVLTGSVLAHAQLSPLLALVPDNYPAHVHYLKEKNKLVIKQHRSRLQGLEGINFICECTHPECRKEIKPIDEGEVHHVNHNPHDNRPQNHLIYNTRCNRRDNGRRGIKVRLSAKTSSAEPAAGACCAVPLSARLSTDPLSQERDTDDLQPSMGKRVLQKHDVMRMHYNLWVNDGVSGPFARRSRYPINELAALAVQEIGTGSPHTYKSYIIGDIGSVLKIVEARKNLTRAVAYLGRFNFYQPPAGTPKLPTEADDIQMALRILREQARLMQSEPEEVATETFRVCVNCSKPFDPAEEGCSNRTCAKCMSRGGSP